MAETIARKDLSTEQKLQLLSSYQSRFDKHQRDMGVRSSGSLVSAGAVIKGADDGALFVAAPDLNSTLKQNVKDAKRNPVKHALKMVCELPVEP